MNEHTITALLDWAELVRTALPELENVLNQRLELEHEYEHVATELKTANRAHAADLDKKIKSIVDMYKEDLEVHTARFTL